MRTTKPISTISFNSYEFLKNTLDNEVKNHHITWYAFVRHLPEEDEKREHFHVYIIPNRIIDTGVYQDLFNEYFENGIALEKPRKCLIFVQSKFYDWYMYNTHNITYLMKTFQARKYQYDKREFVTSDADYFDQLTKDCGIEEDAIYKTMKIYIAQNYSWGQFISDYSVPIGKLVAMEHAWNALANDTYRNNRKNHEESEDE